MTTPSIRLTLAATLFLSTALVSGSALARTQALLVGVADYTESKTITDLKGPRNDVTLLWRLLQKRNVKPEDIMVLTDGLPEGAAYPKPAGLATSSNILAALDKLAGTAEKGDTVIVYYSGHGYQQPDNPARPEPEPEPNGFDQILLPSDVKDYDMMDLTTPNAIVDDVMEEKLSAIRAKGAFVWAVFDACHSATVTRGGDVPRAIGDSSGQNALNIPSKLPGSTAAAPAAATLSRVPSLALTRSAGGLAGFYAVDSQTQAVERPFDGYAEDMVARDGHTSMGVFTYHLHRALTRNTALTFRELAQEIISDMSQDRTVDQTKLPVFDGDLDTPLPGASGKPVPNAISALLTPEGAVSITAGSLQGLAEGAAIDLYEPGKPEKVLARGTVSSATAVTSEVAELQWEKGVTPLPPGRVAIVMTAPGVNFSFTVSPPPVSDGAGPADVTAISKIFAGADKQLGIDLVEAGDQNADIQLRVKDGIVWITQKDRAWIEDQNAFGATPAVSLKSPDFAGTLKTSVWTLARAARLVRMTAAMNADEAEDSGIVIEGTIIRGKTRDAKAKCNKEPPADGQAAPIRALEPADAGNCDHLEFTVKNDSGDDYYVAGLYVDARGGVTAVPFASSKSGCARTLSGDASKPLTFSFWTDIWDEKAGKPQATGPENFVVLAVPKDAARQPPPFCNLTQSAVAELQASRGAPRDQYGTLFDSVSGNATRSVGGDMPGLSMTGQVFMLDVRP